MPQSATTGARAAATAAPGVAAAGERRLWTPMGRSWQASSNIGASASANQPRHSPADRPVVSAALMWSISFCKAAGFPVTLLAAIRCAAITATRVEAPIER
jgi:hypothetical protein